MFHIDIIKDGDVTKVVKEVLVDGQMYVDDKAREGSTNLVTSDAVAKVAKDAGDEDATNQVAIAERFVSLARNGGSIITMRTLPTDQHGVWGVQTTSHGVDVSTTSDGITCGICGVELADWLDRWK